MFHADDGRVDHFDADSLVSFLASLTPAEAAAWWIGAWKAGEALQYSDVCPVLEAQRSYPISALDWEAPWVITDGGLVLRPMHPDDAPALVQGADAIVGRWTSTPYPLTLDTAHTMIATAQANWVNKTAARFTIVADGLIAGTASLLHVFPETSDAEVGYWLVPEARSQGLGRRSTDLLCTWATHVLGCGRLHLEVDWDNAASHATALACGFTPVGPVEWTDPRSGQVSVCLKYIR